jgi:hypothetical protein
VDDGEPAELAVLGVTFAGSQFVAEMAFSGPLLRS